MAKKNSVYVYDTEGRLMSKYKSLRDASMNMNIPVGGIGKNCRGVIENYRGYIFSYVEVKNIIDYLRHNPIDTKKCDVLECFNPSISMRASYCSRHYNQFREHGRILRRSQLEPNEYEIDDINNRVKVFLYEKGSSENINGFFLIDLIDLEDVIKYTWSLTGTGKNKYINRKECINGITNSVYLHRQIMGLTKEKFVIDHIDGDTMNNTRDNLRIVTRQGNNRNRHDEPKNYYYNKKQDSWIVNLSINNKTFYFGSYDTEVEAKIVAKKVREKHYKIKEFNKEGDFMYE